MDIMQTKDEAQQLQVKTDGGNGELLCDDTQHRGGGSTYIPAVKPPEPTPGATPDKVKTDGANGELLYDDTQPSGGESTSISAVKTPGATPDKMASAEARIIALESQLSQERDDHRMDVNRRDTEIRRLRRSLEEQQSWYRDLSQERDDHRMDVNRRDTEIRRLRRSLEEQQSGYRDLMDKIQQDAKILTYRKRLKGAETRLNSLLTLRKSKRIHLESSGQSSGISGLSQQFMAANGHNMARDIIEPMAAPPDHYSIDDTPPPGNTVVPRTQELLACGMLGETTMRNFDAVLNRMLLQLQGYTYVTHDSVIRVCQEVIQEFQCLEELRCTIPSGRAYQAVEIITGMKNVCRVCLRDRVGVIFQECGHCVSCTECAQLLTRCPEPGCGRNITGRRIINLL